MILILCHIDDDSAFRVFSSLQGQYPDISSKLLTSDEIALSPCWNHRVNNEYYSSIIEWSDGSSINSDQISVVLNRLQSISIPYLTKFKKEDQEYATMELYALVLSWLNSIPCSVFNKASPRGLGSSQRAFPIWLDLAAKSGLPVQRIHLSTDSRRYNQNDFVMHEAWISGTQKNDAVPQMIIGRNPGYSFEENSTAERRYTLAAGEQISGFLAMQIRKEISTLQHLSSCDILRLNWERIKVDWKVTSIETIPKLSTESDIKMMVGFLVDQFYKKTA